MTSVYQSTKCTSRYILITQSLCDFCFIKDGHLMYVLMKENKILYLKPHCVLVCIGLIAAGPRAD